MGEKKSVDWKNKVRINREVLKYLELEPGQEVLEEEIGDGNLNDVIRLYTLDNVGGVARSLIIKHAVPYIKFLGEGYPLGVGRINMEYKGLQKFHQISPGSVPAPYFFDKSECAVGMEDLRGYQVLRKKLIKGECDMDIGRHIGRHLGVVHRETHVDTIGQEQLNKLDMELENHNMLALTEQYVFTLPFKKYDETNRCTPEVMKVVAEMYDNQVVIATVQKMLKLFLEKKECLIHGDLHTGSILVKDKDARMFDLEFAYVGPAALDLGMLVANYIFSYYRHMVLSDDNGVARKFANKMVDVCKETVASYLSQMTVSVSSRRKYLSNFVSEIAGFTGCELIRRTVGAFHVEDVQNIPGAEQESAAAGVRLLKATENIQTIDRLIAIALLLNN